jgi:predicted MPP superfamily phosphohydrolase
MIQLLFLFFIPHIFFEKIAHETHLAFAGHTHGGQFRIPLIGSIWLPPGSGKYDQGWWSMNKAKMYVSRGIGTSVLPIRFNCSPELAFIDIRY